MREIRIPQLAESITEGTIVKWLIEEGSFVHKGDSVVELETDKVNVEVSSEYDGLVVELLFKEGDDVAVGDIVAKVNEEAKSNEVVKSKTSELKKETTKQNESTVIEEQEQNNRIPAMPAARKRARELGIDLNKVQIDTRFGPVRKAEIETLATAMKQNESEVAATVDVDNNIERIKMSRRRLTIANRLVEAQRTAAMLTTFNEVDMTEVMNLRKRSQERFLQKHDIKLGFMSFFTKAVVQALKDFPYLNAEIDGNELLLKKHYDIGIAVASDGGLVVPVVRNADALDFASIEREIKSLSEKVQSNALTINDLSGGTFTITNGGVFGSLFSTPILNTPQVGILGMHTIQKRPVALKDETVAVRPMMYIALSYDHRIVDGKEAVQFLARIKELIEDPYQLLLEQ